MGQFVPVEGHKSEDVDQPLARLLLADRDLAEIHLVCLCNGATGASLGGAHTNLEALAEAHRAECRKTAAILRAALVQHLDYPDGNIPCCPSGGETAIDPA
jgi:hypothetical protein